MAVPIRLKNMPQHIRAQYGFPFTGIDKAIQRVEAQDRAINDTEDLEMLKFPKTKVILWDHTATGPPVFLHVAQYRKPQISIPEKVLRLAQRHSENYGKSWNGVLIGALCVDDDCEGVRFEIDRIDTSQKNSSILNSLAPGDVMVPVKVSLSSATERSGTVEDYTSALKLLRDRCQSKDSVQLTNFLLTKGWFTLCSSGDKCVAHMDFDIVMAKTVFKVYPVATVPIVPTALSKNLAGPMSLSHVQGTPKSGFLTMDHTRKILLVLESDPKVYSLPIIGIWVSGVTAVHHPLIWASCLRYLHNLYMQDRVCCPPEQFLLVLYSPTHSKPEFYDVITTTGDNRLDFDIFTGYEVANVTKTVTSISSGIIDCELSPVQNGPKREIFDAAVSNFSTLRPEENSVKKLPVCNSVTDEMLPRSIPTPHQAKATQFESMVPEVSFIFTDSQQSLPMSHPLESIPEIPSLELSTPRNDSRQSSFNSSTTPYVQNNRMSFPSAVNNQQYSNPQMMNRFPENRPNQQNCVQKQNVPTSTAMSQGFMHPHLVEKQFRNGGLNSQNIISEVNSCPNEASYHQKGCTCEFCSRNSAFHGAVNEGSTTNQQINLNVNQNNSVSYNQIIPSRSNFGSNQFVSAPIRTVNPNSAQSRQSFPIPQPIMSSTYPQESLRSCGPVQRQTMSVSYPQVQNIRHRQPQPHTINQSLPEFAHPAPQPLSLPQQINHMQLRDQQQFYRNMVGYPVSTSSNLSVNTQANYVSAGQENSHQSKGVPGFVQYQQVQNASLSSQEHAESSCSGKSSDDSGLSVTPDRSQPSPKSHSPCSTNQAQTSSGFGQSLSVDSINWDQVPPEIYQLIMQQNAQLQQLQSQMQALLMSQSSSQTNVQSHSETTSHQKKPDTCETAVNTTLILPKSPSKSQCRQASLHSIQIQTSPEKSNVSSSSSSHRSARTQDSQPKSETQTPVEIRHKGMLQLNSTQKEDTDSVDMNQADIAAVVSNIGIQNQTVDSIHSDIILDMPSYQSSPSRSQECKETGAMDDSNLTSPLSASMCAQQDDSYGETEGYLNPANLDEESKEYYDKLLDNIRNFLNTHNVDQNSSNQTEGLENEPVNRNSLSKLAPSGLQSILQLQQFGNSADTTFIPKINYMSVMFDSDSDTSVDINAMAMKYLTDEQLTNMVKLQRKTSIPKKAGLLRHVLRAENMSNVSQDVSRFGMSPSDITLDTKKYLEKYGLLSSNETLIAENTNLTDQTLQLRLNYSTITMETPSPSKTTSDRQPSRSSTCSDTKDNHMFTSPALTKGVPQTREILASQDSHDQRYRSPRQTDNQSSPVFPPVKNHRRHVYGSGDSSPVLPSPNRQYAQRCSSLDNDTENYNHHSAGSGNNTDNILDIHKLRQLPKLL